MEILDYIFRMKHKTKFNLLVHSMALPIFSDDIFIFINKRIASNQVHFNISIYDINSLCQAVGLLEQIS